MEYGRSNLKKMEVHIVKKRQIWRKMNMQENQQGKNKNKQENKAMQEN